MTEIVYLALYIALALDDQSGWIHLVIQNLSEPFQPLYN